MADAAAPQNSISAGTSMWMSVKVKYVCRRVLKDTTQGSQKQQQAIKRTMREKAKEGENGKRKKTRKREKMKIMCLHYSASQRNPTGILSSPTLTTDCE